MIKKIRQTGAEGRAWKLREKAERKRRMEKRYMDAEQKDIITEQEMKHLVEQAIGILPAAYVPYSHFRVGAALLCRDGRVFTGVNVENASYPATNCAERTAIFKAVSEGFRQFRAIAICGGPEGQELDYCPPCGICRQVMREFVDPLEFLILLAKSPEDIRVFTLEELLPQSFGPEQLVRL